MTRGTLQTCSWTMNDEERKREGRGRKLEESEGRKYLVRGEYLDAALQQLNVT